MKLAAPTAPHALAILVGGFRAAGASPLLEADTRARAVAAERTCTSNLACCNSCGSSDAASGLQSGGSESQSVVGRSGRASAQTPFAPRV